MPASPSENRTRCRKRKRDSQISRRHQKHEEEEDDDDENPNAEEDLAERDYDSEDQTHHNHSNSQPHVETEVLSDLGVQMSRFPPVIKHSVNRPHSSVTTIVALERALHGIALTRFQLRNLVCATSKHDVYLISNYSVNHWSSLSGNLSEIINFAGHVAPAPTERYAGNLLEGFSQTQISTLAVKDNLLVAGGFQGELTCKRLNKKGVSFCTRTTHDDNAISNAVEIYDSLSGATHIIASNNDCGVREFDTERFRPLNNFQFSWPVNFTHERISWNPTCRYSWDPKWILSAVMACQREEVTAPARGIVV